MSAYQFRCRADETTQPCTYCGAPGLWSEGSYYAPNGHAVRVDGTLECPRSASDRFANAARLDWADGRATQAWDEIGKPL